VQEKAEQEVKAVIDSMLTLLERAEYTTLLLRYVYPPELERILSDGMTVEVLAERFREEKRLKDCKAL
jgi:protein associated with RNAse G/E